MFEKLSNSIINSAYRLIKEVKRTNVFVRNISPLRGVWALQMLHMAKWMVSALQVESISRSTKEKTNWSPHSEHKVTVYSHQKPGADPDCALTKLKRRRHRIHTLEGLFFFALKQTTEQCVTSSCNQGQSTESLDEPKPNKCRETKRLIPIPVSQKAETLKQHSEQ